MGSTGTRRVLTMVAASALALGAVGVAEAGKGKQVKTKLAKTEIGPDGASGKVKAKQKACVKGRKVILKGPEPFDPAAGAGAAGIMTDKKVKIGTDKANGKGWWDIPAPEGGFFNGGEYKVQVKKTNARPYICLARSLRLSG